MSVKVPNQTQSINEKISRFSPDEASPQRQEVRLEKCTFFLVVAAFFERRTKRKKSQISKVSKSSGNLRQVPKERISRLLRSATIPSFAHESTKSGSPIDRNKDHSSSRPRARRTFHQTSLFP
jgi:hypothetical protein